MISDLSGLVAPLSVAEFQQLLCARQPKLVRGNGDGGRYAELLDWRGLMNLVLNGDYPRKRLRLTQRGVPLPSIFYQDDNGPKAAIITQVMETVGSLIFYGIDPYVPAMSRLCAAIADEIGELILGSAIASTGAGGALPVHYDDTDLIVLQVEGSKRWLIEDDPVINPAAGMPFVAGGADPALILDEVLEPGDLLLVPGGYRHRCETLGDRSMHIGFFFYPLTAPRALDLLKRRMLADVADRKPIRFTWAERAEVEASLKRTLIDRIDQMSLSDLLADHRLTGM